MAKSVKNVGGKKVSVVPESMIMFAPGFNGDEDGKSSLFSPMVMDWRLRE